MVGRSLGRCHSRVAAENTPDMVEQDTVVQVVAAAPGMLGHRIALHRIERILGGDRWVDCCCL